MPDFNILYNFKNPIRHFFDLEKMDYNTAKKSEIDDFSWAAPVSFKIFKTENSKRTIGFPNVLNFYYALQKMHGLDNFYSIKNLSPKKRVTPDLDTGEFSVLSYSKSIQNDLFNLTKYDKLIILDIKSFYGRIYTHELGLEDAPDQLERRVSGLNLGKTNGLLLGSYLSLFLAEKFLVKIENRLNEEIKKNDIDCYYEYFSDDFYFFCNNKDIEIIQKLFGGVLDEFELQINETKTEIIDFETYSKNNSLEKLWKKVIKLSEQKDREAEIKRHKEIGYLGHPAFFTQLVYRLSQISEFKYKRIFLANFFKTYYFRNINPKHYMLSESDFNYLCFIYKSMPETILYSLDKVKQMKGFNCDLFKEFLISRFKSSFFIGNYEEAVYIYYAFKLCGFNDDLKAFKQDVLNSKNQVLISYFILDKIIEKPDYEQFITNVKENEWLQNYHYCLVYDKSKFAILIPSWAKKEKQKKTYEDFYKTNLEKNISILKPIESVTADIYKYIDLKIASYKGK